MQLPNALDLRLPGLPFFSPPTEEPCVEADRGKSVEALGVMMLGDRWRKELSGVRMPKSSPSLASSEKLSLMGVSLPLSRAITVHTII